MTATVCTVTAAFDRQDGRFVGRCGLRHLEQLDQVELLYAFARASWGRGLATEAAAVCVRDGLTRAGLDEIIGLVKPGNAASRRVLEKVGMAYVDRLEVFGLDVERFSVTSSTTSACTPRPS